MIDGLETDTLRTNSTRDKVKDFLTSPILTVIVSVVAVIFVLIFLISTSITLNNTAATSSNDMGLMFLRGFGAYPTVFVLLMLGCAIAAFAYGIVEYRKELKEDNSQVIRFAIIGCAFVVVAVMIWLFSLGFPAVRF